MENINTIKAIVTVVAAFLSALLGTLYTSASHDLMQHYRLCNRPYGSKEPTGRRYQFLSQYQRDQEKGIYVAARSRWSCHGSIIAVCIADNWC